MPSGGVECCFEENPTQRADRVPLLAVVDVFPGKARETSLHAKFKPLPFATGDHGIDRFWRLPREGNPVWYESPTDTRIWAGKPVPTH